MPTPCTICASSLRPAVDAELLLGRTPTTVHRSMGAFSVASIRRHSIAHLVPDSLAAPAPAVELTGDEIRNKLTALALGAERVNQDALRRGDGALAIRAAATAQSALLELGKGRTASADHAAALEKLEISTETIQAAIENSAEVGRALVDAARRVGHDRFASVLEKFVRHYHPTHQHQEIA